MTALADGIAARPRAGAEGTAADRSPAMMDTRQPGLAPSARRGRPRRGPRRPGGGGRRRGRRRPAGRRASSTRPGTATPIRTRARRPRRRRPLCRRRRRRRAGPQPVLQHPPLPRRQPGRARLGHEPAAALPAGRWPEGRSVGPDFDTAYYLAQNPEVGAADINPLLHYLRFGRHEGRVATPFDEAEAFEAGVRAKAQALGGPAATLYRGARADHVHFPLLARDPPGPDGGLPLPPLRLAQRIGSVTLDDFESSGRAIRDAIVRALPADFAWRGARCLDFGSGVGRALRHFEPEARPASSGAATSTGPASAGRCRTCRRRSASSRSARCPPSRWSRTASTSSPPCRC